MVVDKIVVGRCVGAPIVFTRLLPLVKDMVALFRIEKPRADETIGRWFFKEENAMGGIWWQPFYKWACAEHSGIGPQATMALEKAEQQQVRKMRNRHWMNQELVHVYIHGQVGIVQNNHFRSREY